MENEKNLRLSMIISPWSPGAERNRGFLRTIYVPPGLKGLKMKLNK